MLRMSKESRSAPLRPNQGTSAPSTAARNAPDPASDTTSDLSHGAKRAMATNRPVSAMKIVPARPERFSQ